jgi:hypothetical protein
MLGSGFQAVPVVGPDDSGGPWASAAPPLRPAFPFVDEDPVGAGGTDQEVVDAVAVEIRGGQGGPEAVAARPE